MERDPLKLSIIIAYYNLEKYIGELLEALAPQIREGIEVILTDDGSDVPFKNSYDWLKVIRIEPNQGTSHARNVGIEAAAGEYLSFIDGDDVVASDFVEEILERIKGNPDYIELSWRALDVQDIRFHNKATLTAKLANPSACTRVFKREFIGDLRFNELKDASEDEDFTRHLRLETGKRAYIEKWMYFYRVDRENSLSMRLRQGTSNTKRIIYHYKHVTSDMTDLLEEIKEEDKVNEVFLFTGRCDIPEMSEYCRVRKPFHTWANELRGEPCSIVAIRERPLSTQLVIYVGVLQGADGISTWIINFCKWMRHDYDITVLYDAAPPITLDQLRPYVRALKNRKERAIQCQTLIMMRLANEPPQNVKYERLWQVVHCVNQGTPLPKRDKYIFVSKTSMESYGLNSEYIYNLPDPDYTKQALILVSTCRVEASDKGEQNKRMCKLAKMLHSAGINFLWFYFGTMSISPDKSMIRLEPVADVKQYLHMADYLIQLSDKEAYCYSIAEALAEGVPVITTPLQVLEEVGFRDGRDGVIVPFDMDFDVNVLTHPAKPLTPMPARIDPEDIVREWRELIGEPAEYSGYIPEKKVMTEVLKPYTDMELHADLKQGQRVEMWEERANYLKNMGLIKIM